MSKLCYYRYKIVTYCIIDMRRVTATNQHDVAFERPRLLFLDWIQLTFYLKICPSVKKNKIKKMETIKYQMTCSVRDFQNFILIDILTHHVMFLKET